MHNNVGDMMAQWLVCRTWDLKVESSSPGQGTHVNVFLDKTYNSHSALFPPMCKNGNQKIALGTTWQNAAR